MPATYVPINPTYCNYFQDYFRSQGGDQTNEVQTIAIPLLKARQKWTPVRKKQSPHQLLHTQKHSLQDANVPVQAVYISLKMERFAIVFRHSKHTVLIYKTIKTGATWPSIHPQDDWISVWIIFRCDKIVKKLTVMLLIDCNIPASNVAPCG